MKFFIDTANLDEIKEALKLGLLDGVTTNPSLFAKAGKPFDTLAKEICDLVPGPVSLEVIATNAEEMIAEGRALRRFGKNVVVKIPLTTEGLKAVKALSSEGTPINVTLIFQPIQALLAAKAGATYVSPFVGRLDDIGVDGMKMVSEIVTIFNHYKFTTEVLVASVRHPIHLLEAARMGAHVATIPLKVIQMLTKHPLTDSGLQTFLDDWKKLPPK